MNLALFLCSRTWRNPNVVRYFYRVGLSMKPSDFEITVRAVDSDNWREVAKLSVSEEQLQFVTTPSYYLALCCYSSWHPLAVYKKDKVIGFMMWGIDDDESCWLGGILIDKLEQRKGYGRKAVEAAITSLKAQTNTSDFALSYQAENSVARHLYKSMGFVETGEMEEDEIVARLNLI